MPNPANQQPPRTPRSVQAPAPAPQPHRYPNTWADEREHPRLMAAVYVGAFLAAIALSALWPMGFAR